jgi:hypothetical protein
MMQVVRTMNKASIASRTCWRLFVMWKTESVLDCLVVVYMNAGPCKVDAALGPSIQCWTPTAAYNG